MGRARAILFLIFSAGAVYLFLALDKGLSGGSAIEPSWGISFMFLSGVLVLVLLLGVGGKGLASAAAMFAALPFVLLIGVFLYSRVSYGLRHGDPHEAEADNVACVVEKAGVATADLRFVRRRINLIRKWGAAGNQRDIEDRMKIRILPDCQFERVA